MATYSITGTCMYCGQMATLNASKPMEGAEANKYITDHCSCDCARHARRGDEVRDSVDKLFGEECAMYGFQEEPTAVLVLIGNLVDAIDEGTLIEATLKVPSGDTCKIKCDGEGNPQITRTLKRTRTM